MTEHNFSVLIILLIRERPETFSCLALCSKQKIDNDDLGYSYYEMVMAKNWKQPRMDKPWYCSCNEITLSNNNNDRPPWYIQHHECPSKTLWWEKAKHNGIRTMWFYLYTVLEEPKWINDNNKKRKKLRTVAASWNEMEVNIKWEGAWRELTGVTEIISIRDIAYKTHQMVFMICILLYIKFTFKKTINK